ncbi:MAG: hypothetical protein AAB415_00550 [Patescibacteria group bacterium]
MITGLPNYTPKKLALFGFLLALVASMYSKYADPVSGFIGDIFGLIGVICLIIGIYRWVKTSKNKVSTITP